MKYRRFEDLPAWNTAVELAVHTYALTATGCLDRIAGLRSQLERASLSVSNNIAEGFERGTHEELVAFLYIARGSAGEVRSMLLVLDRLANFDDQRTELVRLKGLAESASRQLGAWLEALKNSDNKGPRFQNGETKKRSEATRRRDTFLEELRRIQEDRRSPPPAPESEPRE